MRDSNCLKSPGPAISASAFALRALTQSSDFSPFTSSSHSRGRRRRAASRRGAAGKGESAIRQASESGTWAARGVTGSPER